MKKTISLALVFSFIFALAVQMPVLAEDATSSANVISAQVNQEASSSTTDLEKIPSPEHINYFKEIKKIGSSLFGIKKSETEIEKIKQRNTESVKATSTEGLEKISSPEHMNLFEKIKKVGKDLFGVKKTNVKATSTTAVKNPNLEKIVSLDQLSLFDQVKKIGNDLFGIRKKATSTLPVMTTELLACVSSAIDAKDIAISGAYTALVTDINNAITTRGTCQKAALVLTSERQSAINACNNTFNEDSVVPAQLKADKIAKDAWVTYNASLKTCAKNANTTEIKIEDGGQNLTEKIKK